MTGRVTALSQPPIPLADFLAQFEDMESRWPGHFEPYTVELIGRCAMFQKALLARQKSPLEDLPDECIPIALSLRCLVLTHEIAEVGGTIPDCIRDEDEERTYFEKYHDVDPLIDVIKWSGDLRLDRSGRQEVDKEEHIPCLLETLVQTIQRLIMRQDPREWPLILCTLCILEQISSSFMTRPDPMSVLESSSEAISGVYSALCHWFHVCSQTLQPLTDNWEKEAFSNLVDHDPLLLEMFQWFNDGWVEGIWPFLSRSSVLTNILLDTHGHQDQLSMRMVSQSVCRWRKGSRLSREVMLLGEMFLQIVMSLRTPDSVSGSGFELLTDSASRCRRKPQYAARKHLPGSSSSRVNRF